MHLYIRKFPLLAFFVICFLIPALTGAEETGNKPRADEFSAKLGWTPAEAINWLGSPSSLFAYRGTETSEDNVVFYYQDHLYLFWFQDRVWQVRADERWVGNVDGVRMGMTLSEVIDFWGPPINNRDENPTWTLPDRGYPVRVRLYFGDDNRLADIYVYRSDW